MEYSIPALMGGAGTVSDGEMYGSSECTYCPSICRRVASDAAAVEPPVLTAFIVHDGMVKKQALACHWENIDEAIHRVFC